jgi:hypothetical protein
MRSTATGRCPGFHLGAGCLFAPGRFALEFPYDPALYFHGEEQALAARLFTHGWDIVHMPGLPIYHLYNDGASGVPPRPLHWDPSHEAGGRRPGGTLEQRSRRRLASLLAGEPLGVYGLGTRAHLADYAAGAASTTRPRRSARRPSGRCRRPSLATRSSSRSMARHRSAQALALSGRLRSR